MPLNKLDNFIKNTEGRILYVSPSDLDSTDSIDNQGNSLARPFKTLQRALIEAARFSYVKGNSNDIIEKTTILLMPGEHEIDNRPGLAIYNNSNYAYVRKLSSSGIGDPAQSQDGLDLNLASNFDLTQEHNVLYKFNSVHGGVVVPRGTSIVGLDLRKTKLRPKYVPNPTDPNVPTSAIFRITGSCYFWQFSIFDGNDLDLVYTDPINFGDLKKASPTFSHNKLTVFEYCDGINNVVGEAGTYDATDLDMYYYKVGNAYNQGSTRPIEDGQKYPISTLAFEAQRPEYEIVGAFATDPIKISNIIAGDEGGASSLVTVTTAKPHKLQVGTPIKIRGVVSTSYNISAFVTWVSDTDDKVFTYTLPDFDPTLTAGNTSAATVTVETDTVEGASPYIFNCSMRSVYGMNGMLADGSKATGFRSMVVAQFTGISLQKDDRAFTKYIPSSRSYDSIPYSAVDNGALAGESSAIEAGKVYHLDSGAVYRSGWETSHIKIINDAILQIVSVFAIGYTKHFEAQTGGDASITNSNSNFGQLALVSDGFKKTAFDKDNQAFITSIVAPRTIESSEEDLDWIGINTEYDTDNSKLYLYGYNVKDIKPPVFTQGYKVGAKLNDKLYLNIGNDVYESSIVIPNSTNSSHISYKVTDPPSADTNNFKIGSNILQTGEKVIIISDDGDLPENIEDNTVYYVIRMDNENIQLASSFSNANNVAEIEVSGGTNLHIISRVTDKQPGELGHPVQWDTDNSSWYINVTNNTITSQLSSFTENTTDLTYIKRKEDPRSLDEKTYQIRVVVPKESTNAKNPENGFIIQESSSTGFRNSNDFTQDTLLTVKDPQYNFKRNPSFISTCTYNSSTDTATIITELSHKLNVNDTVIVENVTDSNNTVGVSDSGFNGTFEVSNVVDNMTFEYKITENVPGTAMTNNNDRNVIDVVKLPRFQRNNLQKNLYIYRNEIISEYIKGVQDGIYHLYVLSADHNIPVSFPELQYSQNVRDLYPQMDRDNPDDNPQSSKSFAVRSPLGKVVTNDLKKSLTRESTDTLNKVLGIGIPITSITTPSSGVSTITFSERHGFAGILTGSHDTSVTSTNYNDGSYFNVKLFNDSGREDWRGATANVVVDGGAVGFATIVSSGSGQNPEAVGDILLYYDVNSVGGVNIGGDGNAVFKTNATGISSCLGNVIQFTGSGITTDSYATINSIINDTQISIAKTDGDPDITTDQYALPIAPSINVNSTSFSSGTKITSFTCSSAHGLFPGNSFRVVDSDNNNKGDFIVYDSDSVTTFSALTTVDIGNVNGGKILKHGLSANEKVSDKTNENLGIRANPIFDNDIGYLGQGINNSIEEIQVSLPGSLELSSGNNISDRFPYGSYIQVGEEMMRIASPTITGVGNNILKVLRGVFSSKISDHAANSLIKKIKPLAIEFRRPSILRASGHTFEYLGYGPGNYSTALPQVQDRTLTEREEFLAQSQEKSGGIVVYTGMNSKGDFYIGNLKKSSATGEETTYDTPVPTITGQDPARLSAVFDEVIIKERILVEGGASNQILSQFDGPVTINKGFKVTDKTDISGKVSLTNEKNTTSINDGALVVDGGVGIAKNVYVGKDVNVGQGLYVTGISTLSSNVIVGAGITLNSSTHDIGGATLNVSSNADVGGKLTVTGNGEFAGGTVDITSNKVTASTFKGDLTGTADKATDVVGAKDRVLYNSGTDNTTTSSNLKFDGTNLEVGGDIYAFTASTSDIRLKDNISPIKQALDKVNSISGNTFNWNEKSQYEGKVDIGVIAQEIEALNLPEVTTTRDSGYKVVRYEKLVPLLIEAIKELSTKVDNLEALAHPKPTGKTQKRNEDRLDALENKINN